MATTRTWVGGGNNSAANPNDWSPTGRPAPGDTLIATDAAPLNIAGNALAGDTVSTPDGQAVTFNMTNGSSLKLATGHYLSGMDNLNINASGIVNLNAILSSCNFSTHGGTIHFIGSNSFTDLCFGTIDSNIYGQATLHMSGGNAAGSALTLGGDVGFGIRINLDAFIPVDELTINHPGRFFGLLNFTNQYGPGFGTVDLVGMHATSGMLSHGLLELYNGKTWVDQVRVAGYTSDMMLGQTTGGLIMGQPQSGPHGTPSGDILIPVHNLG